MSESMKLDLSPEEVNYVLMALSQRPLGEVINIFSKIKSQAEAQAKPLEKIKNTVDPSS